ncbi:MAG: tryptophan synthase subunit alpha [Candidatus Margulisiibacteriota bacterium]
MNKNKKLLIPYITAGDPSLAATEKLVYAFEKAGADIIELGIPFSDPLADGPIIQASHQRALKNKVTLKAVIKLVAKLRKKSRVPLVFMLSVNLIYRYGVAKFVADAQRVGLNGLVIPDLPPEERTRPEFVALQNSKLNLIALVAPNTPEKRIQKIAAQASGFIYLIAVAGVTGVRAKFSQFVAPQVKIIRKYTKLPVCIGFGISNPAQAKAAAQLADGVIVGSAIVKLLETNKSFSKVAGLVRSLRQAID